MSGENIFIKVMGCIIANMISAEYNEWMADYFTNENSNNYLRNKCNDAYKAEQKVLDKLKVVDVNVKKEVEQLKDLYTDFIFSATELEPDEISRVMSLIDKIKKSRQCADTQTQS